MVECVKHALLSCDLDLWRGLIELAKVRQWADIGRYLMQIVMFKAAVVESDPIEQGERAILNLGHTMGHAVESLSVKVDGAQALTHGEAVAIGLCHALKLSKDHVGLQNADVLIQQLKDSGLVPKLSSTFLEHLSELPAYLKSDKKNKGSSVHWVLLRKFGEVARTPDGGWTIPIDDPSALTLSPEMFQFQ
jgi:3-dehydroquinate synthase